MTLNEVLKSITIGLTKQTETGKIKWLTNSEVAKVWEPLSFYKEKDDNKLLTHDMYYKCNSKTLFEWHLSLRHDRSIASSYMSIKNPGFQDGAIAFNSNSIIEYGALEKALMDKYVTPRLNSQYKSVQTDIDVLVGLASICGVEAARDMKIDSILDEKDSWFKRIF